MHKSRSGFTIVELLIVIVVIGILAAITIVAYNGVQNKANDAAVQSDLSNIINKLTLDKINSSNDSYSGYIKDRTDLGIRVSQGAYTKTPKLTYNLLYCLAGDGQNFAVLATSKSGTKFIADLSGVRKYTGSFDWTTANVAGMCSDAQAGSIANGAGYYASPEQWANWVITP